MIRQVTPSNLPAAVELCTRDRECQPCLGVLYRPQPDVVYCYRCGGNEAGVRYVRGDLVPRANEGVS